MRYPLRVIPGILIVLLMNSTCLAQETPPEAATAGWPVVVRVFLFLLPVLAIFIGAYFYLRHLQRNYHQACMESAKLELLAKSPLGLPDGTIGAMMKLIAGVLLIYIILAALVMIDINGFRSLTDLLTSVKDQNILLGVAATFFLVLVIIGAVFYMQRLQTRFFDGCIKTSQIDKFFQAPAGLPEGTIRAVLALMIVAVSLFFMVFQFFFQNSDKIPQGLMTLLTAVVAFYFANRASTQGAASSVASQTQGLRDQRDAAVKEQQKTKADSIIGKVNKALQVTRAASAFLPEAQRKKYDALAEKLQTGLSAAEGLLKRDNPAEAADLVSGALGEFRRTNPVFQAVDKALPVFTRVLGNNIPALGLITTLVGVGVRIGSARYERWKLRILQAPIDAAALPIQPIDGLQAESLFRANPVLAQAFASELSAGRSADLAQVANDFLNVATEKLWAEKKYRFDGDKERFESQAIFEKTVQALRRLLNDDDLQRYVEPAWLGSLNNYQSLVNAVDKLHENEEAEARLDQLVLVTDGLMREGQPVLQIMDKVEEELKKDGTVNP